MQLKRIPIDTSKLRIGMYVAKLDRPWEETPFVFQGFEVKEDFEIKQLQTYCSKVFVEVGRGKLTEKEVRALAAVDASVDHDAGQDPPKTEKSTKFPAWAQRLLFRLGIGKIIGAQKLNRAGTYTSTATVRSEASQAKKAYENCVTAYQRIFKEARRTGTVDMQLVVVAVTPIIKSILRNPDAMAWTVFSGKRGRRNYNRAVATAVWAVLFGRHLNFDLKGLRTLAIGGLLLDIGNSALPEYLRSAPGAIDENEYELVLKHVQAGIEILRRSKGVDPAVFEMLADHHERFDGTGYPNNLKGSDITPHGRIAGIVDCYDAMTTKTSYSPAVAAYDAAREMNEMRDQKFHAEVVEQFLKTIGMFPTGSIVEINNGSTGLVLEQNSANPLQPKVLLLKSSDGESFDPPRIINEGEWGNKNIWIARGHEHGAFGIDPLDYFN